MTGSRVHLTKSLYLAGLQCPKLLWWRAHEPLAPELQPDKVLEDRFDQARQVGELARALFPGGVLIDRSRGRAEQSLADTQAAIASDVPAIFEATFAAGGVQVAVDVLLRIANGGWQLIEAKSASSLKDEHIPDTAVQWHVLAESGLDLEGAEVVHLNKEFRHPSTGNLLTRADVTAPVRAILIDIPDQLASMKEVLEGELPEFPIGAHCGEPRDCPFERRCWPQAPDHIGKLYLVGFKRADEYFRAGIHSVWQIPPGKKLSFTAQRQLRALKANRMIVEPTLPAALAPFKGRLGFLDFETISRAVPVWDGTGPWQQLAAQFSYHESLPDGTYSHAEFLAEGADDCRPALARAMIEATKNATGVVTYSSFEKTRIRDLQVVVPELEPELKALEEKLIDLLPVVRDNVYHPDFQGSFSIKYVLHPLVPELSYDDLIIVDGLTASVEIARLLFVSQKIAPEERERVRRDLLAYCERDTWAMVRLLERMRELSSNPTPTGQR